MTDHAHQSTKRHGIVKGLVVRLYSLGLLIAVTWISYSAFAFLFGSVFSPKLTPDRFTNRPLKLDLTALDANDPSGTMDDDDTAPLNHYHGVGKLALGRSQSGCLTSGCHTLLPHSADKATRALANFHMTFLDCAMCHRDGLTTATETGWQNVSTQEPQSTPALLQLMAEFQGAELPEGGDKIVELLRDALATAHFNPMLSHLLIQLETSQQASPMHRHALARLREALPSMARGDYGAVIAPRDNAGYTLDKMRPLIDQYFALGEDDPQRDSVNEKIHANVIAKPRACQQCHDATPTRIDFAALGYSDQRIGPLQNNAIANMVQQIREGRPFYLPDILETSSDD